MDKIIPDTNIFKEGPNSSKIPNFISKYLNDLKASSNSKKLAVGAVAGWGAGYLSTKFGKLAAMALGGSLLLIQIAKYNGYVEIDWNKFNQDVKAAQIQINKSKSNLPAALNAVQDFAQENVVLAGGFASGFLLGIASA